LGAGDAQPRLAAARRHRSLHGPIDDIPRLRPWTDDFNNLFQILQ
jgi:hypothetical protein